MKFNNKILTLIHKKEDPTWGKTYAYAISFFPQINDLVLEPGKVSPTLLRLMLDRSELHPKNLINRADPHYQKTIKGHDLDADQWIQVIIQNPNLLAAPIALYKGRGVLCCTPTDLLKVMQLPGAKLGNEDPIPSRP